MSNENNKNSFVLNRRSFGLAGLGLALSQQVAFAQQPGVEAARPGVIELFTSQGCSSCPPADALMLRLAEEADFIPLTFATEIWDYLGWKDTLAMPAFTRRHKAYAAAVANKRVYTPQAIVNGRAHCVGSDFRAISKLKRSTLTTTDEAKLQVERNGDGWAVTVQRNGTTPARLVLLPLRQRQLVEIRRGENAGQSITYANVVRGVVDLGQTLGAGQVTARIERAQLEQAKADAFAVLVQLGSIDAPADILAARLVKEAQPVARS
jgi:hypothetical protein